MFDPLFFETELRDEVVTVEIMHIQYAELGSWFEPPTDLDIEFIVLGNDGELDLTGNEKAIIFAECLEHLEYAKQERDI